MPIALASLPGGPLVHAHLRIAHPECSSRDRGVYCLACRSSFCGDCWSRHRCRLEAFARRYPATARALGVGAA